MFGGRIKYRHHCHCVCTDYIQILSQILTALYTVLYIIACYSYVYSFIHVFIYLCGIFAETDLYHRVRSCAEPVSQGHFFYCFTEYVKRMIEKQVYFIKHYVHIWTVSALSHNSLNFCVYLASLYTEQNTGLSVSLAFSLITLFLSYCSCLF